MKYALLLVLTLAFTSAAANAGCRGEANGETYSLKYGPVVDGDEDAWILRKVRFVTETRGTFTGVFEEIDEPSTSLNGFAFGKLKNEATGEYVDLLEEFPKQGDSHTLKIAFGGSRVSVHGRGAFTVICK